MKKILRLCTYLPSKNNIFPNFLGLCTYKYNALELGECIFDQFQKVWVEI